MGFDTKHVALFLWTDLAAELGITADWGTVLPFFPPFPQFRVLHPRGNNITVICV